MPLNLILKVSRFKFRGSEGSSPFGRPSDIFKNERIRLVLEQLEDLLDNNGCESDIRSQPPSPIRLRQDEILSHSQSSSYVSGSLGKFGTQIPDRVQRNPPNHVDAEVSKPGVLAHLLDFFSKTSPSKGSSASIVKDTLPEYSFSSAKTSQRKSILAPMSADRVMEMTCKLEAMANKQNSQFPPPTLLPASDPKSQSPPAKSPNPEDLPVPMSDDSEKENSQESLKDRREVVSCPKSEPVQESKHRQETGQMTIIDQFQDSNPFQGHKRVPRRFVRIQQTQQALLESKDSWYRPLVSDQPLYANLPAQVRDDLIAYSERRPPVDVASSEDEASEVESVGSQDSDDSDRTYPNSTAYGVKAALEDNEGLDLMKDEDNKDAPAWQRTQTPPAIAGSVRRREPIEDHTTGSNGHQQSIVCSSIPDSPIKDIDESIKSEDDMPDEESVSWASSPEQKARPLQRNIESCQVHPTLKSDGGEIAGRSRQHFTNMDGDTDMRPRSLEPASSFSRSQQHDKQGSYAQSICRPRAAVVIPSSSPVDEELEFALPYAIGDLVEENDSEEEFSKTFQSHPSTAVQSPRLVQVEQTPFPQFRYSDGRSLASNHVDDSLLKEFTLEEFKRVHDLVSSDPRIPATCEASGPRKTIPGSSEAADFDQEAEMKTLILEYRSDPSQDTTQLHAKITVKEADEDDDLAQQQLFIEHESSQLGLAIWSPNRSKAALSIGITVNQRETSPESHFVIATPPRASQTQVTGHQSSPLRTPIPDVGQLDGSSPMMASLKRDSNHIEARHLNPRKRPCQRKVAETIGEEEDAWGNPKEMAYTKRQSRKSKGQQAVEIAPVMSSPSDAPNSTQIIPGTNPANEVAVLPPTETQSSAIESVQHIPATFYCAIRRTIHFSESG